MAYSSGTNTLEYGLGTSLSRFPAELLLYYGTTRYILPAYFAKKKPLVLAGRVVFLFVVSTLAYRSGRFYFFPNARINSDFADTLLHIPSFLSAPFYFLPIPALGLALNMLRKLFFNELEKKELARQTARAEIDLLKSQIQPHFLFNTLNNLYGLSVKASPQMPASILGLSKIMEYMLYDAAREKVLIGQEIRYIESYIELEQLRYGRRLQVSCDFEPALYRFEISPLIFFTFVENAFKHGAGKEDGESWISLSLKQENGLIVYKVVNSIPSGGLSEGPVSGHGLRNLRRRLQLAYPDAYTLKQKQNDFSVLFALSLDLSACTPVSS